MSIWCVCYFLYFVQQTCRTQTFYSEICILYQLMTGKVEYIISMVIDLLLIFGKVLLQIMVRFFLSDKVAHINQMCIFTSTFSLQHSTSLTLQIKLTLMCLEYRHSVRISTNGSSIPRWPLSVDDRRDFFSIICSSCSPNSTTMWVLVFLLAFGFSPPLFGSVGSSRQLGGLRCATDSSVNFSCFLLKIKYKHLWINIDKLIWIIVFEKLIFAKGVTMLVLNTKI